MADWKVLCVDHVGIAVDDMQKTKQLFEEALNIHPTSPDELVEEQKVNVSFFKLGEAELEFLESTSPDGPIARYIAKHGNGFQHVALRVDNIENALEDLKARGVRLLDEKPRYGAGGCRIAFLHPKATNGLLIELTQRMS
ncbi:MAG: methylmalonyl-CoA epimerase [Veillonellaceae bacterium]|nr:methylmalonyl-CoA epimerase [Veillonellaceae bacterium]